MKNVVNLVELWFGFGQGDPKQEQNLIWGWGGGLPGHFNDNPKAGKAQKLCTYIRIPITLEN